MTAPRIVVVVDGWEHFEDHSNPMFIEGSLVLKLRETITTGTPLGVHVVAIGGEDMLTHKLPSLYSRRLLLPFPKEDTRRFQLTSKMASPPLLPGRAIDASTGHHVQIGDIDLLPAELVARSHREVDPALLPRQFPSLPERISTEELARPDVAPSPTWVPLGIGGPDTSTVGIDLFAGAQVLLVSGPSGSGRTSAAAAVAHGLRRVGIGVLALAPPGSPLPRLLPDDAGVRLVTGVSLKDADLRETAAEFGDNPYAVVVDDVTRISVVPEQESFMDVPTLLDDAAQPSARGRVALVLTADATPILNGMPSAHFRLVSAAVSGGGACMLLTPANRPTAAAHNLNLEPDQYFTAPPGRGYLTLGQGPMLVQLATPG